MKSYTKEYGHLVVSGDDITTVIKGLTADVLCEIFMDKYHLKEVEKCQFYPMDRYLALLFDIEQRMPTVLKKIGMAVIDEALFPPDVTTFEQALAVADTGYYMNHPDAKEDEIGHYLFEKESETSCHMIVDSPYPCIFDEVVTLGIAKKFNVYISLEHKDGACRRKGAQQCHYRIEIKGGITGEECGLAKLNS